MSTLDFSGLNEPIKELAKAQVQVGIAAVGPPPAKWSALKYGD
jgi:hypothetical protein